jgi:hypothetical protein
MTPHQLAVEIENAFDYRDREAMLRFLARLVVLAELHRKTWQGVIDAIPQQPQSLDSSPTD